MQVQCLIIDYTQKHRTPQNYEMKNLELMKFGASRMIGAWQSWRSVKNYQHSPDQLAN